MNFKEFFEFGALIGLAALMVLSSLAAIVLYVMALGAAAGGFFGAVVWAFRALVGV